jgi:orotate phosphoribosyltransferase
MAAMATDILLGHDDVMTLLRQTGAFREGHFALPIDIHTNHFIQMPLALRYYRMAKVLCVGLSRLLRGCREVATALPRACVIAPPSGGIPVAYGVGEVLQAEQILWVEREEQRGYQFHQYMGINRGDKCILVDDIVHTGETLRSMVDLIRDSGGEVIAVGVLVSQRLADVDLGDIPFFSVVQIQTDHYPADACRLCQMNVPLAQVHDWV